ncbi:MAG: glycosyl transferase, partial [Caldilineae bacterium]
MLISHDTVGPTMAGPGIRYYHLARVLGRRFELRLAGPEPAPQAQFAQEEPFSLFTYQRGVWPSIEEAARWAEVIILPSDTAADFPQLRGVDAALVIDGYDPLMAEWLALHGSMDVTTGGEHWRYRMQALHHQFEMGDFFICASERQRDWWLGLLEAHGRLNPWNFAADPSFRRLLDVVAYGLPDGEPKHTRPVIKGVWPGIGPDDRLVLWGGGLWLWLDPLTAIRAVARIWQQRQDVRLVFPGTRHPNPMLAEIGSHNQAAKD